MLRCSQERSASLQIALEGSLHAALAGIHRRFIARCYRRGCPAVALQEAESCTTAAGFVLRTVKRITSYPRSTFTCVFTRTGAPACSFLTLASSLGVPLLFLWHVCTLLCVCEWYTAAIR
jgi:hypothetical protein